jgi:DNA-binding NarL/FixJ family response regulator
METRILIAEPQCLLREGLVTMLDSEEDFEVVGQAENGIDAVRLARACKPDIALIELLLPRLSGLDVIERIRKDVEHVRCIAISASETRVSLRQLFRGGASGYLLKSASPSELFQAIRTVRMGQVFVSPAVAGPLIDTLASSASSRDADRQLLTTREREILQLIAEGLSSKEIAVELGVATKTVDAHRSKMMGKLGIHKVSSLVRFAVREGLVCP